MSYLTIKNYVDGRLKGLGYKESKEPFEFDHASERTLNKTYILTITEGSMLEDGSENLNTEFIDFQSWNISIAFERSEHNDVVNRDKMYRSIEAILKDLDNPTNYLGTVRYMRYNSWEVEEVDNYFLLRIKFDIQDRITY